MHDEHQSCLLHPVHAVTQWTPTVAVVKEIIVNSTEMNHNLGMNQADSDLLCRNW